MDQFTRRALIVLTILFIIGTVIFRIAVFNHARATIERSTADKQPSLKTQR